MSRLLSNVAKVSTRRLDFWRERLLALLPTLQMSLTSGSISGRFTGIKATTTANVNNAGSISASESGGGGIRSQANAVVTNSGTISAVETGIGSDGSAVVTNTGSISAGGGIGSWDRRHRCHGHQFRRHLGRDSSQGIGASTAIVNKFEFYIWRQRRYLCQHGNGRQLRFDLRWLRWHPRPQPPPICNEFRHDIGDPDANGTAIRSNGAALRWTTPAQSRPQASPAPASSQWPPPM